jgi:ATP-independent RNA helicase DbpA
MTPIQSQALPLVLSGKDLIGQAKTGSGKTAAFGLGLLSQLDADVYQVQSLVLCPTRELADQVAKQIRKLARTIPNIKVLTLCGGVPMGPQIGSLEQGAHIVVGTPGRIEDHLRRGRLKLKRVTTLVLDEADRMLEMGFQDTLEKIVEQIPNQRQTLLFSATYPNEIQSIAKRIMDKPELIKVESTHDDLSIQQHFYQIETKEERFDGVRLLLLEHRPTSTLVFCNTKREAQELSDRLKQAGFSVSALHGDLDQRDRDQTLIKFSNKSIAVLIATDVASRGLDIDSVDAVINYHIAQENEIHTHRIGRTGRAGAEGKAFSLYNSKEHYKVAQLGMYLDRDIVSERLPAASLLKTTPNQAVMATLKIDGGKKQKLRPGDILGALTGNNSGEKGIAGASVGEIDLADNWAYVAVARTEVKTALKKLSEGKLKGKNFRVRRL